MIFPFRRSSDAPAPADTVRRLSKILGLSVAIVIALGAPLLYYTINLSRLGETTSIRGQVSAGRAARYIYGAGDLWPHQKTRLEEIIALSPQDRWQFRQTLKGPGDHDVLVEDVQLRWPLKSEDVPIVFNRTRLATLQIQTSLAPLLEATAWFALLSALVGALSYWCLKEFPLRALQAANDDIIEKRASLKAVGQRLQLALDNMSQGLALFDLQGHKLAANLQILDMLNVQSASGDLTAAQLAAMLGITLEPTNNVDPFDLRDLPERRFETTLPSGRTIKTTAKRIVDVEILVTTADVTKARQSEQKITFLAHNDALTGLTNRARFNDLLSGAMAELSPRDRLAVLCIDLDKFKLVNDTLGHAAGDDLLRSVAVRICGVVRRGDTVARLGGDEFAILIPNVASYKDAEILAGRIVSEISVPFEVLGSMVEIGASVGFAIGASDATDADDLMKKADIALYRAKAEGRGTFRRFLPGMDEEMRERLQAEADLRNAIANKQFELFYQPLYGLDADEITGFEALIRWRHPERGLVPPLSFIPLAEETGLIRQIGRWALQQACTEAARWSKPLKVAVNLSAAQFSGPSLPLDVAHVLAESGINPDRLELEITEGTLLQDTEAVLGVLHKIKELGCRIVMDDFGTGYSSLAYLQRFPFDKLKIDRAFVSRIDERGDSLAIVRAITSMSRSLGIETTGEGVETEAELACLRDQGCDQVQGYLFSRPVPSSELQSVMSKVNPLHRLVA